MKRVLVLVPLVLAGCPSKSAAVDAGSDAALSKGPKAKEHVETTIVDKGTSDLAFHVHSRFGPEGNVELFPLEDGMAALQWVDDHTWKLSTFAAGKPPRALTGRVKRDVGRGEIVIRGATDLAFVLERIDGALHRVTPEETKLLPNRYTHVVEMRRGQWAGLEVVAPDESTNWDFAHGEYKVVGGPDAPDAGAGALPLVPSNLRLKRAVRLADGKICADATAGGRAGTGIWTADVEGHQAIAPFAALDLLFRGADGECYALDRNGASGELHRVKGDDTKLVAEIDFHKLGNDGDDALRTDREGGIWFVGKGYVPRRIVVTEGVVTTTKYSLPEKLGGKSDAGGGGADCVHPAAMRIFALDPNDVWIFAACRDAELAVTDMRSRILFHSGPPETYFEWPAP